MRSAVALCALACFGCASQSFQPQFKVLERPTEALVLQEVSSAKPRDERPVAVGITADSARLFAWDLSAGLLWERTVRAKSAPLIVGDAIVLQERAGVTVRDLASGEVRAVVDEEGALIGADGEGRSIAITLAYEDDDARSAVAYVVGDSVRWKQSLKLPAGAPALVNGRVIVPWATQRLSVLDAKDGRELVRWHLNHTVLGQARVDRGRVYVGQLGWLRLNEQLINTVDAAPAMHAPLKRALPGQPPLLRDGYAPISEPESAHHRLQLEWRIGTGDALSSTENDLLALRFYRMLFGLDAHSDTIAWVRTFDNDLVGAAIEPGGLFVADSAGVLRFLDTKGATLAKRELGRALQVIAIRPGGWTPVPVAPAGTAQAPAPVAIETPLPTLSEQLFAAASLDDARLGAARAYAAERLAAMPEENVTAQLVSLCTEQGSPQPLLLAACSSLGERRNGAEHVLLALRRRASFLEGSAAPPVGALARAAGRMQLKRAAPLLVSHVEDPSTPASDLVSVVETLERLGHKPAIPTLERLLRMHHAEPEGSDLTPALYASMHALGALRARSSRASLEEIARDALATQTVRDKARETLALIDTPPVVAAPSPREAERKEPIEEEDVQTDSRPYSLAAEMVRKVLKPIRSKLAKCLTADPAKPKIARVSMVISGAGSVEGVFVAPSTVQACSEPLLREIRFPATRLGRQRITHVIQ